MTLEWFRKEIANQGDNEHERALAFEDLDRLIAPIAPADSDPFFIPHFGGRVCPGQPHLRGAWLGLTWKHTLGHLYKAVFEGVALEYGIYMNILSSLYTDFTPEEIRITGGGEKSLTWNQIKADVLGIPVIQIQRKEGAPMGSALLAGFGVGLFSNVGEAAAQWIELGSSISPSPEKAAFYQQRIRRYAAFMDAINTVSEENVRAGLSEK